MDQIKHRTGYAWVDPARRRVDAACREPWPQLPWICLDHLRLSHTFLATSHPFAPRLLILGGTEGEPGQRDERFARSAEFEPVSRQAAVCQVFAGEEVTLARAASGEGGDNPGGDVVNVLSAIFESFRSTRCWMLSAVPVPCRMR